MSELNELIASEVETAERDSSNPDAALPTHVRVTRGHERSKVLQVRLNEGELEALAKLADERGVPASTFARAILLEAVGH